MPAAVTSCVEGRHVVRSVIRNGPVIAHVRMAELADQNPASVLGFVVDFGSAIDGRATPAPANPAARSAPTPFTTKVSCALPVPFPSVRPWLET